MTNRIPNHEAVAQIKAIAASSGAPSWVIADALRQCVNGDLGQVALAIASIDAHDGMNPYGDVTVTEATAQHWAASADLAAAANDAIQAHQIDELPAIARPILEAAE